MRLGLAAKIVLTFTLLILTLSAAVGVLVFRQSSALLVEGAFHQLEDDARLERKLFQTRLERYAGDVRFLANTPPIQGIRRARAGGGVDAEDGSSETAWKDRLSVIFHHFLASSPDYFQVRYISGEGREIVRVERSGDSTFRATEAQLQDNGERPYVRTTLNLPPGRIHISPISLNREHDKVSLPVTPTLHVTTSVAGDEEDGRPFGLLVINVHAGTFLESLRDALPSTTQLYLADIRGKVLLHPDPGHDFSFEYRSTPGLGDLFPSLIPRLSTPGLERPDHGHTALVDENVLHLARLGGETLAPGSHLWLLLSTPRDQILARVQQVRDQSVAVAIALLLVGLLCILFFARRLIRPLESISRAADAFVEGTPLPHLPVQHNDEIGVLARTFTEMTQHIRERTHALKEREQRLTTIMETVKEGIVILNADGRVESINPTAVALLGGSREALIGCSAHTFLPVLAEAMPLSGAFTRETTARHRSGEEIPAEISVSPFHIGERRLHTLIVRDITERHQIERERIHAQATLEQRVAERTSELRTTNEQLLHEVALRIEAEHSLRLTRQAFENTSEAIVITDIDGIIVDINDAYTTITGYSRREALGARPEITASGRHDAAFYRDMWGALIEHGHWSGEIWDRRKSGEIFPKWLTINAVADERGATTHYVGIFTDITEAKATEARLEQLAYYDPLTALPNRALFQDRLGLGIRDANRHGARLALLFLDLDRFKLINDTLGHARGDELLCEVARRILGRVRANDTVARLGGDEFTIIVTDIEGPDDAAEVATAILDALGEPIHLGNQEIQSGCSVGIGIYPDDAADFDTLTRNADTAMYQSKGAGGSTYRFFSPEMDRDTHRRLELEGALRQAIRDGDLTLHYQPKLRLADGEVTGVEALVRWRHPERGLITPAEFIPMAEETGLIVPLGRWVLNEACRQMRVWDTQGFPPLRVAINLSARQFQEPDLIESIQATLRDSGLGAERLVIELTESTVMAEVERAVESMDRMRRMGLAISVDDFGTGYSSLSYLKRFPIQALKIDRSFIRDCADNSEDRAIVAAILSLAKSLGVNVVAEGVETIEQLTLLHELGCDEIQGYLCAHPAEAERLDTLLEEAVRCAEMTAEIPTPLKARA